MPYIPKEARDLLDSKIVNPEASGELNYKITTILIEYLLSQGLCYQTLNDISGTITECLAEFRRRVIVPYEDIKKKQNGDCYCQSEFLLELLRNKSKKLKNKAKVTAKRVKK